MPRRKPNRAAAQGQGDTPQPAAGSAAAQQQPTGAAQGTGQQPQQQHPNPSHHALSPGVRQVVRAVCWVLHGDRDVGRLRAAVTQVSCGVLHA